MLATQVYTDLKSKQDTKHPNTYDEPASCCFGLFGNSDTQRKPSVNKEMLKKVEPMQLIFANVIGSEEVPWAGAFLG